MAGRGYLKNHLVQVTKKKSNESIAPQNGSNVEAPVINNENLIKHVPAYKGRQVNLYYNLEFSI